MRWFIGGANIYAATLLKDDICSRGTFKRDMLVFAGWNNGSELGCAGNCAPREYARAWMGIVYGLYAGRLNACEFESLYEGAIALDEEWIRLILLADDTSHARARQSEFQSDPVLDAVTLGERKSMARRLDLDLLERLAKDSEPSVIRILLGNPKLTEPLVLRMISLRPHRAAVLKEIACQPRWLNRATVRRALVLNPYTPVRLAMLLCPLLDEGTAREVNDALNLHPGLRRLARGLLEIRPHPRIFRNNHAHDEASEPTTLDAYLIDL